MFNPADIKINEAVRYSAASFKVLLPVDLKATQISQLLSNVDLSAVSKLERVDLKQVKRFETLLELWTELPLEVRQLRLPQIVVLIHGIRTQAEWQEAVFNALDAPLRKIIRIKYSYFDAFSFLCPWFTRTAPIQRLRRELLDAIASNKNYELIVIAHSFGTFAVSEILKEFPIIQPSLLVFCGCIVSENFCWDTLVNAPPVIVNDCAVHDIWPVLARFSTWGYGATGRFGFGSGRVNDRFHDFKHSGFLNSIFATKFWLPLLDDGKINSGITQRPTTPLIVSLLAKTRIYWVFPVGMAILCFVSNHTVREEAGKLFSIMLKGLRGWTGM